MEIQCNFTRPELTQLWRIVMETGLTASEIPGFLPPPPDLLLSNLSSHTPVTPGFLLLLGRTSHTHATKPGLQIVAQLIVSLPSGFCSSITLSDRPPLVTLCIFRDLITPCFLYHGSPRMEWNVPRHRPTKRKQTKTQSASNYHHASGLLHSGDGRPFWGKAKTKPLLV